MVKELDIEKRLDRIADIYNKLSELMQQLPVEIPEDIRNKLIEHLLGDKDLRDLIDGIKNRRPPRFILIGRTGSGKSSLINAICGKYLAETSDVKPGTVLKQKYRYESMGKTIFEVIDTRGIGESLISNSTAEDELKNEILNFSPDAILFLVRAKTRDYIDEDINLLKEIDNILENRVPIIAFSTQVDELEPAREKEANTYSERKMRNIKEAVLQLSEILKENKIDVKDLIPVSSYVEWSEEPTKDNIDYWHEIKITYDGRYNIDKLIDVLENNIDIKAGIYLNLFSRVNEVTTKIAKKFNLAFSSISGLIGATPIPISDIFILTALQIILLILIGYLSGRDLNYETAKELLVALGGAGALGYGLRVAFQQGSKLFNLVFPGSGSGISGGIAATGTYMMGTAAIEYFINGIKKEELSEVMEKAKDEYKSNEKTN